MKNVLAYLKRIDLRCANCLFYKTEKCPFPEAEPTDRPCADGLLIQRFGQDVLLKQANVTLLKPNRFLTSSKTKLELMKTFGLDKNEVEEVILQIKLKLSEKQKPKAKSEIKPAEIKTETEEDLELRQHTLKLLKETNLIQKFIQHQNRYLVMDYTVRKLLLLACASAYGDYPLNVGLTQVFSSGKTTTTIQTCKYFPSVWFLGGLSPKALIHEKGEYNEETQSFIVDLRGKILVFLDEPLYETLQMLKPLLSHDRFETEYKYVDKQTGETVKTILKGWPSVIFCSPKSRYTLEYCSRWLTASPQTSTEKIHEVIKAKGQKAQQPEEEDKEFETWQNAFKLLAENGPYKIVVPYGSVLAECFRSKKPIDMRFFDLFLALIKASTILHAFQRERDNQNRLIATLEDFENAYEIFQEIEKPTTLGLGQNVIDFYQNILQPLAKEDFALVTYDVITQKYEEVYEEPIGRDTLRENYLKPLAQKGLIDFEPHPNDKRKKVITVKGELPQPSLLNYEVFIQKAKNILEKEG